MIVLACDHAGFDLMQKIRKFLKKNKIEFKYMGSEVVDPTDDYPDRIFPACKEILKDEGNWGIFTCGTGVGVNMVANRHKGIRAVRCTDTQTAFMARRHNNANVLCLGGRVVSTRTAFNIIKMFLQTEFEGGRHQERLDKFN